MNLQDAAKREKDVQDIRTLLDKFKDKLRFVLCRCSIDFLKINSKPP